MKYILTINIIIFTILMSFSQGKNYEVIAQNVTHYEFNKARDKIYYLVNDEELFLYDIRKKTTTNIYLSEEKFRFYELYISETDTLYVRSSSDEFFKIFEDKYVEFIPFIIEGKGQYHPMDFNKEEFQYIEKILTVPDTKIEKIDAQNYIVTPPNSKKGDKRSFSSLTLSYLNNQELSEKINTQAKEIKYIQNADYQYKNINKKNEKNYFKNNNIIVKEKMYFCELFYLFSQTCKYKITVKSPKQKIVFKAKSRVINSSLILSNSKFISDYNKNIYLTFPLNKDVRIISFIKIKL